MDTCTNAKSEHCPGATILLLLLLFFFFTVQSSETTGDKFHVGSDSLIHLCKFCTQNELSWSDLGMMLIYFIHSQKICTETDMKFIPYLCHHPLIYIYRHWQPKESVTS